MTSIPKIIDCTLREGRQALNRDISLPKIKKIIEKISSTGVEQIEIGHAGISKNEVKLLKEVVKVFPDISFLTHSRALKEDIDAVIDTGIEWIGIFISINEYAKYRINNFSLKNVLSKISDSISYAKNAGLKVRFTIEDSTRTEKELLEKAFKEAIISGADRICISDTVGILEPRDCGKLVESVQRINSNVLIEFHAHNDRGLAIANSLQAFDSGATWLSSSVNGIGERSGITDTCILLANFHYRGTKLIPEPIFLKEVSDFVSALMRVEVSNMKPVIGDHSFTHTADLHLNAMKKNTHSYNWIDPELFGIQTKYKRKLTPYKMEDLILKPDIISADELKYHKKGYGDRYLLLDQRKVQDTRTYCIVRNIPFIEKTPDAFVSEHIHKVDSFFVFIGNKPNLEGLTCEVLLDDEAFKVESPCTVFIPSGTKHTYRIISGEGQFFNHVLSGSYNESLLEDYKDAKSQGWDIINEKFWKIGRKTGKPSIREIEMYLENVPSNSECLVIGSSTRDLIVRALSKGINITVVDFSASSIKKLKEDLEDNNLIERCRLINADILSQPNKSLISKFDFVFADRLINRFTYDQIEGFFTNISSVLKNKGEFITAIKPNFYPMDLAMIQLGKNKNTLENFYDENTRTINFSNATEELREIVFPHGEIPKTVLLKWYYFRGKESRFLDEDILNMQVINGKKIFDLISVVPMPDAKGTNLYNFKKI